MENKEFNLSELWHSQQTEPADIQEISTKIMVLKNQQKKKKYFANISLCLTLIVILSIWFWYDYQYISTPIGISLIVLAILFAVVNFNQFYNLFDKLKLDASNQDYLSHLLEIERKQLSIQKKIMNIYFSLLTLGFIFYFYEFALKMNHTMAILVYVITFGWFAFVWFILKPKINKSQNDKIQDLIQLLKRNNNKE